MIMCEYLFLQAELLKRAMPKPRQPLSEEVIELIASRFRALGEASRLKLIIAIETGEKNVSQLVAATGLSQPNVSRHLHTLTDAGILARRKKGANVIYAIVDPTVCDLFPKVSGSLQKRLENQAKAFNG